MAKTGLKTGLRLVLCKNHASEREINHCTLFPCLPHTFLPFNRLWALTKLFLGLPPACFYLLRGFRGSRAKTQRVGSCWTLSWILVLHRWSSSALGHIWIDWQHPGNFFGLFGVVLQGIQAGGQTEAVRGVGRWNWVPVKRSKERLRGIHSKDTTSHSDTSPIIVYIIVCEVRLDPPPPLL